MEREEALNECVSRDKAIVQLNHLRSDWDDDWNVAIRKCIETIKKMPSVSPQPKMGKCKNCKHFEYDSVAKVNGIPLIVAHEICNRWGDGCQSKEDGYCFLFEPKTQESEVKHE